MKKVLLAFAIQATLFLSCGAPYTSNLGYPRKISIEREGGIRYISGDVSPSHCEIDDYNGNGKNHFSEADDSCFVTCRWLTVKFKRYDITVKIIAEPNTTGKSRTLYVSGFWTDEFFETKVTQK